MGSSIYPRIENTNADWVHDISGKALSREMEQLYKLIKSEGHKDLMEYYVPSQEDLDEFSTGKQAEEKWFNPIEGLSLIEAMTRAFHAHRAQFAHSKHLEADLNAFRKILDTAAANGLRWNLGISY